MKATSALVVLAVVVFDAASARAILALYNA